MNHLGMRRTLTCAACLLALAPVANAQVEGQLNQFQQDYIDRQRQDALRKLDENGEETINVDRSLTGLEGLDDSANIQFDLVNVIFRSAPKLKELKHFDEIANQYVGNRISITDLNAMVLQMNQAYRADGHHNAQVILPPQQIAGGIVELMVVESTVSEIAIEETSTWAGFYDDRLTIDHGQLLDLTKLSKQINWLNRTTDLRVTANLEPGAIFGTTDIALNVVEPPKHQLYLTVDDWGYRSSGSDRGTLSYTNNNLFGSRDRLDVSYTGASTADTGFISYSVPVNRYNGRIGGVYAVNQVEIVNEAIGDILIVGKSKESTLYFSQPVYVDTSFKVQAMVGFSHVPGETFVDGVKVLETDLDETYISVDAEYIGDASYVYADARYVAARPGQDYTSGMNYSRGTLVGIRRGSPNIYTMATVQWQFTPESALPSSRFIQVGGPTSVRGYPTGALSSIKGYSANIELHYESSVGIDAFLFVDNGWAEALGNKQESLGRLSSVGAGVQYKKGPFVAAAHFGKPIAEGRVDGDDKGRWQLKLNIDLMQLVKGN